RDASLHVLSGLVHADATVVLPRTSLASIAALERHSKRGRGVVHIQPGTDKWSTDLPRPLGARAVLAACPEVASRTTAVLLFIRRASSFTHDEIALVRSAVPVLSLTEQLFAERADMAKRCEGAWERPRTRITRPPPDALTDREREIVEYVCLGYQNAEI